MLHHQTNDIKEIFRLENDFKNMKSVICKTRKTRCKMMMFLDILTDFRTYYSAGPFTFYRLVNMNPGVFEKYLFAGMFYRPLTICIIDLNRNNRILHERGSQLLYNRLQ